MAAVSLGPTLVGRCVSRYSTIKAFFVILGVAFTCLKAGAQTAANREANFAWMAPAATLRHIQRPARSWTAAVCPNADQSAAVAFSKIWEPAQAWRTVVPVRAMALAERPAQRWPFPRAAARETVPRRSNRRDRKSTRLNSSH